MLIIFGVRGRFSKLGTGTFYCPRCQGDRTYVQRHLRRWFTLFFIPVFPISGPTNEHVLCETCDGSFKPDVLTLPHGAQLVALRADAFRRSAVATLAAGDPRSAVARLTALGAINGYYDGAREYAEADLDEDLRTADPELMSVYAAPVTSRLDARAAEHFVAACVSIALADGPMTPPESQAARRLAESFDLTPTHLAGIVGTQVPLAEPAAGAPSGDDEPR